MKLSSTLLSAMALGLSVEMGASCKKETISTTTKAAKEVKVPAASPSQPSTPNSPNYPHCCPACGMG